MPQAGATRKLFFALWPTDETRAALVDTCRPALSACQGRPVAPHHYHVTLAFIGLSHEPLVRFDPLVEVAAEAPPEFELILDRFGHWPRPRVLWIGPRECPAGLTALAGQIRTGLDALGVGYDRKDFKPHLTLARKVAALPELDAPLPVHWQVRGFVLVTSLATEAGPVYEVVRRFPFGASSGAAFSGGSRHDP